MREYTRSGNQSRRGSENIPAAGTNRGRGESIYPQRRVDTRLGCGRRACTRLLRLTVGTSRG
eukprot:1184575-Prorocentrum_minimum.AAC.1